MARDNSNGSNINIYQVHAEMVKTLAKGGDEILALLTPDTCDLWHHATGLATEAGELLDAVKKVVIYNQDVDRDNVIEELGDIEFYLAGIRNNLRITRETILAANMQKLAKRYPGYSYSDAAAKKRADKAEETRAQFGKSSSTKRRGSK